MSYMPAIRVLVVDHFEDWPSAVNAALSEGINMQVVAIAPDGPEAVRQAQLLRPDLVLIDIAFTSLSGLDTAQEIVRTVPKANIVFVNSDTDPEAVRTALTLGALYCQAERRKRSTDFDEGASAVHVAN